MSDININDVSPMMKQYMEIKKDYLDTILFFRIGDFYEMFFEDALLASKEMEIALTGKDVGLKERVPMCGIPFKAYLSYLEKLVAKGYKVAICEQLEDPKTVKGMVKRGVIQVVTKGTILEGDLDQKENNFIASIYDFSYCYSFSFADITTGIFYTSIIDKDIIKEVLKENIKEVIVNDLIDRKIVNDLRKEGILVTITDQVLEDKSYKYLYEDIKDIRLETSIKHLLSYLISSKKGDIHHLKKIEVLKKDDYLYFDSNTVRNLELLKTLRNNKRDNSLIGLLDKTKTGMGGRYLEYNLLHPLKNKREIEKRYDVISKFLCEFILAKELEEKLDQVYDLERLAGRINYGNLTPKDMVQLKNTLVILPSIRDILKELDIGYKIDTLSDLSDLLEKAISENPPFTLKEGGLIKDGYDKELDELRSVRKDSKHFLLNYEKEEKEKTGIKNLKIGYNKVFGYYIEISNSSLKDIKPEFNYIRKQTLTGGERFINPLLKEKEAIILNAEDRIIDLEYNLFMDVRLKVKDKIKEIQEIASVLGKVDMLLSFAVLAGNNSYVRPEFSDNVIRIEKGRHPVVEEVLKEEYVPNDILMNDKENILLITGPNMAGKSTYMREMAIISIMAQMGSFVPASKAILPIFDQIFTRIGASDDLVGGESTFMIEMKEANLAIQNATKNSLILFDELGRGTATYDGMALAQSILEYVHGIGCKVLFSTHYHELTSLESTLKYLRNVHVGAKEENGELIFLHEVKRGAVDKSYGIHVASLAHLPKEVTERAEEILKDYESPTYKKKEQLSFNFEEEEEEKDKFLKDKIKEVNPLEMTPLEALNFLAELKDDIK